jgi:hypothetical protein
MGCEMAVLCLWCFLVLHGMPCRRSTAVLANVFWTAVTMANSAKSEFVLATASGYAVWTIAVELKKVLSKASLTIRKTQVMFVQLTWW